MAKITLKTIKQNKEMRDSYLDGFSHGNIGVPKQRPSYERDSYAFGYKDGKEGNLKNYFEIIELNEPKANLGSTPFTRQKSGTKK